MESPNTQPSFSWGYIVLAFTLVLIGSLSILQCFDVYRYTKPKIVVDSIAFHESHYEMLVNDERHLQVVAFPDSLSTPMLKWSSSADTVASVNHEGTVTAVGVGRCYITAEALDVSGVKAVCEITVKEVPVPVEIIAVYRAKTDKQLQKGDTIHLSAVVVPENATNKHVSWRTSHQDVATADSNGVVTIIGEEGTDTIYAEADNGVQGTYVIQLKKEPPVILIQSIKLIPPSKPLKKGQTVKIDKVIKPTNATNQELKWSILDNSSVAVVDPKTGTVTIKKENGTFTIKAESTDGSGKTAQCSVSVKNIDNPELPYGKWKGDYLNGKPNGKGVIEFNKTILVTDGIYAQKGYTLRNARFVNGTLISGTLYDNEGQEIRAIVSDIKLECGE